MVGDEQSAQTSQKTDADRQPDDFLEDVYKRQANGGLQRLGRSADVPGNYA